MNSAKPSVLENIRIMDCTSAMAGPYCGKLLAELGAEVIKIEPPSGCLFRQTDMFSPYHGESYALMIVDANKKFIKMNLKSEKGKKLFMELLRKSDILIENYAPGTMERLVGSYESMVKENPRIIYCKITGFGMTGPLKDYSGYAWTAEARSGLMDMEGFPDQPPVLDGVAFIDTMTGTFSALSIMSALYRRMKTNKGQYIDIGLFDVAINSLMEYFGMYLSTNRQYVPKRWGNSNNYTPNAPKMCYETNDGYVLLIFFKDADWHKLLEAMGKTDLKACDLYNTYKKRIEKRSEVETIVEDWTRTKTRKEVCQILVKGGFTLCSPVQSIDEAYQDPQVLARNMFEKVKHPEAGVVEIARSPFNLSETPGRVNSPGCPLGYHNKEIYGKLLGYSSKEIDQLENDGVI